MIAKGIRNVAKLLFRASEILQLHYSFKEIRGIITAIGFAQKRQTARLLGYNVNYMNAASFRLAAYEVFVRGDYFFVAPHDSPVILDCGANIGLTTLFFKWLYPKACIHSFEADPTTSAVLRINVEQNRLHDVTVSNLLLSDHAGTQKFYVVPESPGNLMMSANASYLSYKGQEICVQAGRLSDYIDGPIDLLKLDVEGSELTVMRDLIDSSKIAQISKMLIEYHHKIGNGPSQLSTFLAMLEKARFEYHIAAQGNQLDNHGAFRNTFISAYRA